MKTLNNVLNTNISWSFYYSFEPFGNSIGTFLNYRNVYFNSFSRYFGDFYVLDENKYTLGSFGIYDVSFEVGYKNVLFGSLEYYISLSSKYEYYFIFSDIYIGGRVGLSFDSDSMDLFGSFRFEDFAYFEGIFIYEFGENVIAELGFSINQYYSDFFGFFSSKVFEYSKFRLGVNSGIYYGTLKGILPFFSLYFGYKDFLVSYGFALSDSLGIFQFLDFDLNM